MPFIVAVGALSAIYILSFLIMHALGRRGSYLFFRCLLLPGIIVHELSHVLACLLTGTPIVKISFWDETGGSVVHHKPKLAVLVQPIISLAPFGTGLLALTWISHHITLEHMAQTALLSFLMISIAATLAPSKTDIRNAAHGLVLLGGVGIVTQLYFPQALLRFTPLLGQLNQALGFILIMLLLIWGSLLLLHRTLHHITR